MQQLTALRPLVAAGAVAVGASLIALTPAVSNNVAADLHRSAAAAQQRAVQLLSTDPGVVNPIQTWINVFTDSAAYLQADFASATTYGFFPVLEQELANQVFIDGTQLLPAFQTAANAAVTLYTSIDSTSVGIGGFWPNLLLGISQVGQGDFTDGFATIANEGIPALAADVGIALEPLLPVLPDELDSLPSAATFLLSTAYVQFATAYWLFWPQALGYELGGDVQAAYDGFASGDLLAGVTNLLNIPGAFTGQFLNGGFNYQTYTPGLLTPVGVNGSGLQGLLPFFTTFVPQGLANSLVYPGAPNIVEGGNFAGAVQQFLAQLSQFTTISNTGWNGWPTPTIAFNNLIDLFQTYTGVGGLSAAATGASAANLAGIAPSIAANVAGLAPSIATDLAARLPAELGTLAANVLTSLF